MKYRLWIVVFCGIQVWHHILSLGFFGVWHHSSFSTRAFNDKMRRWWGTTLDSLCCSFAHFLFVRIFLQQLTLLTVPTFYKKYKYSPLFFISPILLLRIDFFTILLLYNRAFSQRAAPVAKIKFQGSGLHTSPEILSFR